MFSLILNATGGVSPSMVRPVANWALRLVLGLPEVFYYSKWLWPCCQMACRRIKSRGQSMPGVLARLPFRRTNQPPPPTNRVTESLSPLVLVFMIYNSTYSFLIELNDNQPPPTTTTTPEMHHCVFVGPTIHLAAWSESVRIVRNLW